MIIWQLFKTLWPFFDRTCFLQWVTDAWLSISCLTRVVNWYHNGNHSMEWRHNWIRYFMSCISATRHFPTLKVCGHETETEKHLSFYNSQFNQKTITHLWHFLLLGRQSQDAQSPRSSSLGMFEICNCKIHYKKEITSQDLDFFTLNLHIRIVRRY